MLVSQKETLCLSTEELGIVYYYPSHNYTTIFLPLRTIMEQASSSLDNPGLIVAHAFWKFIVMFCGSALLGIVSALASALVSEPFSFSSFSPFHFFIGDGEIRGEMGNVK